MLARRAVFVVSLALAGASIWLLPSGAGAHDALSHEAEDSVPHDIKKEPALESFTSQATARDAASAAAVTAGLPQDVGQWGPVVDWPVVGVHVALLPNGKVLAYDSVGDQATEKSPVQNYTRATVWDPATGTQTDV